MIALFTLGSFARTEKEAIASFIVAKQGLCDYFSLAYKIFQNLGLDTSKFISSSFKTGNLQTVFAINTETEPVVFTLCVKITEIPRISVISILSIFVVFIGFDFFIKLKSEPVSIENVNSFPLNNVEERAIFRSAFCE